MPDDTSPYTAMLGERIRFLREQRGLTVRQLAVRAETSPGTITKLEHGNRGQLSFEVAARLASAFDVSLDYLAGFTDILQPLPLTERTKRRMKRPRHDDETEAA